jgi:hypothetical protein
MKTGDIAPSSSNKKQKMFQRMDMWNQDIHKEEMGYLNLLQVS